MAREFKDAVGGWTTDVADTDSVPQEAKDAAAQALPVTYSTAAHLVKAMGDGRRSGVRVGRTVRRGVGRAAGGRER